jgi:cobalt-zinc-cadmium efflux system membrane fusion protein
VLRLTEGERVRFRLGDGAWLGGSVLYIGQKVKGDSRTVSVQVQMDKLSENILPGMFVEAEIILEGVVTSTLPAEAVAEFNGKKYALMKENQDGQSYTLKRVEVIPELTGDGFLTIVNAADFPKGSLFLSSGVEKLISE